MINSTNPVVQTVNAGSNVIFTLDRIRTKSCRCHGWLNHDNGSALYTITKPGVYQISYNSDITSAQAGVGSLSLRINGEPIVGSKSTYTIATANAYGNVSASVLVTVPCNGTATISLVNSSGIVLSVQEPNISFIKFA